MAQGTTRLLISTLRGRMVIFYYIVLTLHPNALNIRFLCERAALHLTLELSPYKTQRHKYHKNLKISKYKYFT